MWKYLRLHEAFVRAALLAEPPPERLAELRALHLRTLADMQHERLIHLLVTLAIALFFLLSVGYVSVHPTLASGLLALLLCGLLSAYLVHYFRLENGVQRWYHLTNRIEARLGWLGASYEGRAYQAHGGSAGAVGDPAARQVVG